MKMIAISMHWQQWYMLIGYSLSLMGGFTRKTVMGRFVVVAFSCFGLYALWSGGFFFIGCP
jgi:hypothetical protein